MPMNSTMTSTKLSASSATRGRSVGGAAAAGDWMENEMAREVKTKGTLGRGEDFKLSKKLTSMPREENEKGITVGGAKSDQEFHHGAWFPTDGVKHVMIIKILGETSKGRVEKAVTVKTKQECPTCGTKNKHGTKFCRECGTGLEQV